jgi:hypothetical protein
MRKLTLVFLFFTTLTLWAQKLPKTNLFAFELIKENTQYRLQKPQWLSQFNPNGYNNQPNFITDDELYISVQFPWDTTQTDIYSLNISTLEFIPITNTKESEYSPKRVPGSDEFSVVRVDADTSKTQRLWRYPLNRSGKGYEAFKYYQSVGYYHWCSPSQVFMFMVGKPKNYYQLTKIGTENNIRFHSEPARCLLGTNDGKVAYIEKENEDDWYIKTMNPESYQSDIVVKTLNQSEDFALLKDGTYLMGKGSTLYQFTPKIDQEWMPIADLRSYGIKKIERLAVNSLGKLVIVTK